MPENKAIPAAATAKGMAIEGWSGRADMVRAHKRGWPSSATHPACKFRLALAAGAGKDARHGRPRSLAALPAAAARAGHPAQPLRAAGHADRLHRKLRAVRADDRLSEGAGR